MDIESALEAKLAAEKALEIAKENLSAANKALHEADIKRDIARLTPYQEIAGGELGEHGRLVWERTFSAETGASEVADAWIELFVAGDGSDIVCIRCSNRSLDEKLTEDEQKTPLTARLMKAALFSRKVSSFYLEYASFLDELHDKLEKYERNKEGE